MRTYEDVKVALTRYRQELEEEAKTKSHYVVVGGNMCITKKGASTQYILGKGDPVPMIKSTAKYNMEKQQARLTDDVHLEIIPYWEWLESNIKECEKLCICMEDSLNGDAPTPAPGSKPEPDKPRVEKPKGNPNMRVLQVAVPDCPLGINTCMACKFCEAVDLTVLPWMVNCTFNGETC